ncbi:C2 domain-containing protein 5-like isoform X1 [Oscarella lobularis]|uniref:C2 domain-containing protein 5-like isoform X1 n=1 Tax=Oscarella lobularis TaxID=121494 RepID=UPI003313246D
MVGFIQARICRNKKKDKGESNAVAVSDALPFLQHDVHRQLLNKLKVKGMNAVFGLRIQVTVGESLLVAIASGTAVYLAALPKPSLLTMGKKDVREQIIELTERNRALYNLTSSSTGTTSAAAAAVVSQSESDSDSANDDGDETGATASWDHRP